MSAIKRGLFVPPPRPVCRPADRGRDGSSCGAGNPSSGLRFGELPAEWLLLGKVECAGAVHPVSVDHVVCGFVSVFGVPAIAGGDVPFRGRGGAVVCISEVAWPTVTVFYVCLGHFCQGVFGAVAECRPYPSK